MPTYVLMPALELAQETGKIIRWLKAPGSRVEQGEPLVEIETDKVTTEIEAPASGILDEVTGREGDAVPVGQPIAVIREAGAPAEVGVPAGSGPPRLAPAPRPVAAPTPPKLPLDAPPARLLASPKARRLAAERGLDLATLRGSGPGGAVLAADVAVAPLAPPVVATPTPAAGARPGPGVCAVWRVMAERMTASWTSVPHFYLFREVEATRLRSWRDRVREQGAVRVTYTDLLVKLVAAALSRHPEVNAAWREGAVVQNTAIDVGLAVAVEAGLVVPVLRGADALSITGIAAAREDLVSRAQGGRLRPPDIQGGGFTISNLGAYGVDAFQAIVNPPQAAILAVGRIADRVIPVDGQPAVRPTIMLTLSCDHRALDGARGARFLGTLAGLVEEPLTLLS